MKMVNNFEILEKLYFDKKKITISTWYTSQAALCPYSLCAAGTTNNNDGPHKRSSLKISSSEF